MAAEEDSATDSAALWREIHERLPKQGIALGPAASATFINDPRMIAFMAARYKFVAKMINRAERALEIGCGDGFGAPIVAQSVLELVCTDIYEESLLDCRARLASYRNIVFEHADLRAAPYPQRVRAAFCVDVLEHIYPAEEAAFLDNITASIEPHGILLIGTPNAVAERYASEYSRLGHVNLKDHAQLSALMEARFHTVFMFAMNDEVVHTGYLPMAHYLWAVGVGPISKR